MSALPDCETEHKPNLSFTGQKLDWMTGTAYDRRLRAINFRIPFQIAQHANEETGKSYPSQETLADLSATSIRTVKRTIMLLQATGWLKVRRNRTYDPKTKMWKTRNFYWLRYENVQTMFDLIAASKADRRHGKTFTGAMGGPCKGAMGDTLTPSYKHLQKRRSLPREGKDKREVERVPALVEPIGGEVISIGDRRLVIMKEVWVGGRRLRVIQRGGIAA